MAPASFSDEDAYIAQLLKQLADWQTDIIALAGYMIKIPAEVINRYEGRILNIHPALLPKFGGKGFYGQKVHEAVIQSDEIESGCTVHLVTEQYDEGPILAQAKVTITEEDDASVLAKRILEQEHLLYPKVIAELADKINTKSNT